MAFRVKGLRFGLKVWGLGVGRWDHFVDTFVKFGHQLLVEDHWTKWNTTTPGGFRV